MHWERLLQQRYKPREGSVHPLRECRLRLRAEPAWTGAKERVLRSLVLTHLTKPPHPIGALRQGRSRPEGCLHSFNSLVARSTFSSQAPCKLNSLQLIPLPAQFHPAPPDGLLGTTTQTPGPGPGTCLLDWFRCPCLDHLEELFAHPSLSPSSSSCPQGPSGTRVHRAVTGCAHCFWEWMACFWWAAGCPRM